MPTRQPLPIRANSLRPCAAGGCSEPRVQGSASHYCGRHRYYFKLHGHPLQRPHKIAEIRRWDMEIRSLYRRLSPTKRAQLADTAASYCAPMRAFLKAAADGHEGNRFATEAGERLLRVFYNVDPLPILTRVSALYLMRERSPWQFHSDEAFRFALVRAVRKLTSTADGSYWDDKRQRVKQVVRPIQRRTVSVMGGWLVDFASPWVLHTQRIAAQVQQREQLRALLASEQFNDVREKLQRETAKLERKLATARRLAAEKQASQPS